MDSNGVVELIWQLSFSIIRFVKKRKNIVNHGHHNFLKPKLISKCRFSTINRPKAKIRGSVYNRKKDKEKYFVGLCIKKLKVKIN